MKNKILLIEFVVVDRFHCGISLPYINGILKRRGFDVVYLRAGLLSRSALNRENRVDLDKQAEQNIIQELIKYKDPDILFSHLPSNKFIEEVKKFTENIYFAESFDSTLPNVSEFYQKYSIDERFLFEEVPDFSFVNVNELSQKFRPLPHLILSNECNYRKSLNTNPIYNKIKLPKDIKDTGCTFCVIPNILHKEKFDLPKVKGQILSALRTVPWGGFRRRIRIIGEIIVYHIDNFIDILLKEGVDDTDLLFNFRVDNFIKNRDRIESALKRLSRTKNRLYLALVGIENFSNEELLRYNKGFYNYDIFKFLSIIFELKNRYSNCFDYSEYGGFSLILFNPFTRIEDLRLNYHTIKYLNIENLCGKLFTSRIRLYEELPFYHLVKDSGLIVDNYKDEIFDTARKNFYKRESPWRYKDKRVERFNLYILKNKKISLDKAIIKLNDFVTKKRSYKSLSSFKLKDLSLRDHYFIESIFMTEYPKRKVGKVELETLDEANEHIKWISKFFKYYEKTENRSGIGALKYSIFYGFDKECMKRCIELTELLEEGIKGGREEIIYREVGKLLGYPDCCSKLYANKKRYKINIYLFMCLYQRYQSQSISPYLNPFLNLFFVPCDLNCKNSIKIMKLLARIDRRVIGVDLLKYSGLPIIFLLPLDPSVAQFNERLGYVIVEPLTEVEDEFSYKPIVYSGEDKRLQFILSSNRLYLKDGFMHLYQGKRHIHTLCAEANVWYYKKALDYKFWRRFTEAYYASHIYAQNISESAFKEGDIFADIKQLIKKGDNLFRQDGFIIGDIQIQQNVLSVLLKKIEGVIELRIQFAKEAKNYFKKGRQFAVSIGRSNIEQSDIDKIVDKILSILENG